MNLKLIIFASMFCLNGCCSTSSTPITNDNYKSAYYIKYKPKKEPINNVKNGDYDEDNNVKSSDETQKFKQQIDDSTKSNPELSIKETIKK